MNKVNPFYLKGLSKKDSKKHKKYILERRKNYKKGNFTLKKPKLKILKNRKSQKVLEFEKKYNIQITNSSKIEKELGIHEKKHKKKFWIKDVPLFLQMVWLPESNSYFYGRLASVILKKVLINMINIF